MDRVFLTGKRTSETTAKPEPGNSNPGDRTVLNKKKENGHVSLFVNVYFYFCK